MGETVRLSQPTLHRLRPTPGARREVRDAGADGLILCLHPGGAASWIMRFRRQGRMAKLTLGSVDLRPDARAGDDTPRIGGHLALRAARMLCADVQRQRAGGRDVVAERASARQEEQDRAAHTFDAQARRYIEQHARPRIRRWKETARTLGLRPEDLELVRGGIAHRWRGRPVHTITGHDIYAVVEEARTRRIPGMGRRTPGPSEDRARKMFSTFSEFFGWLVKNPPTMGGKIAPGWALVTNPCAGMARPKTPAARERVLSNDELRWLWRACDAADGPRIAGAPRPFAPLVRLLMIAGHRRSEVAGMMRSELTGSTWTLPAARAKNKRAHTTVLPLLAREVLATVPGGDGLVFTTNGTTPVSGFSKVKERLDAEMMRLAREEHEAAGREPDEVSIAPWRFHDLRRTVATGMARAGADLHVIERALNHVSGSFGGIVGVYQRHRYEPEVKAAFEAWANLLRSIVERGEPSNVVPLAAGGAR